MNPSAHAVTDGRDTPLSTNQRAVREVAREVLRQGGEGARLPTAVEFQERLGVGSGTVQKALRILNEAGAVEFRARGHRGRFVTQCDLGALWGLAALPPVRALITPPGAVDVYGLTAGIQASFEALGVHVEAYYHRGSKSRVSALADHSPAFAVLSNGAVDHLGVADDEAFVTLALDPATYYSADSVVVLTRGGEGPEKAVGIDHDSPDHVALTEAQFEPGLERVECQFPRVPAALLEGRIDVGIWHRMQLLIPPDLVGLEERPLDPAAQEVLEAIGAAALVARAEDRELVTLMAALDTDALIRRRSEVVGLVRQGQTPESAWFR